MAAFEPYKVIMEILVVPNAQGTGVDMGAYFECDGTECRHCDAERCHLTKNIRHARKFSIFDRPLWSGERDRYEPERDGTDAGGGEDG